MIRVGLTGGYATGKSFVAGELAQLGCHLIYADELGHTVLQREGEAYQPVVDCFGAQILDETGAIDRKKLGVIAFGSADLLEKLTGIVHPAVFKLEAQMLEQFCRDDPAGIAVIEAAILIETGRFTLFDRLILTVCDETTQIARAMKRDHATRDEVLVRLAKQWPSEIKKRHAHFVIDTGGAKENTARQVKEVYGELRKLADGGGV